MYVFAKRNICILIGKNAVPKSLAQMNVVERDDGPKLRRSGVRSVDGSPLPVSPD